MSQDAEREFRDEFAPELHDAIVGLLRKLNVSAHISYAITEEIAIHFWRDLERLYAIHHEQINVTKSCSYIAFWVRKLKPISDAYPLQAYEGLGTDEQPNLEYEITDINEQASLHLSLTLLRNCIEDNRITGEAGIGQVKMLAAFDKVSEDYLTSVVEDGTSMGPRFDSMVYDMRFRTYGPHHLTHFLVHIMREIYRECAKSPRQ